MTRRHGRAAATRTVVPGEFPRSREVTFTGAGVGVRVSAFKASPEGLFATITVVGHTVVVDPVSGFAGPNDRDDSTVSVWVRAGSGEVASEIQGGAVRHPETVGDPAVSTYDLWFPLRPSDLDADLVLHIDWPTGLGQRCAIPVSSDELREAVAHTLTWPLARDA